MSSTPTLNATDTVNPTNGNSIGVSASGAGVVGTINGTVIGTPTNPISWASIGSTSNHAVSAVSGGKITLNSATIYAAGFGVISNQANSIIIDNNSVINSYANAGASAQNTASMTLTGTTINLLSGFSTGMAGITVYTSGIVNGSNVTINGGPSGARGLLANSGNITLTNSHINNITDTTAVYTNSTAAAITLTNTTISQFGTAGAVAYAASGSITLNSVTAVKDMGTALLSDGATGAATLNTTGATSITVGTVGDATASIGAYARNGGYLGLGGATVIVKGGDAGGATTFGALATGNGTRLQADSGTSIDMTSAVAGATGVGAQSSATLQLTGTTVKAGDAMTGIGLQSGANGTLYAAAISVGANGSGISADGLGTTATLAATTKVAAGSNSTAVRATNGAYLTLGNAQLSAASGATNVTGILADSNSAVSMASGKIQTDATGSGAVIRGGSNLTLNNTQVIGGTTGISADGANTNISIQSGSDIQAANNSTVVAVTGGAIANIGSSSVTGGANSTGISVDGSSVGTIATAISVGSGGTGIAAQNNGSITLTSTQVTSGGKGVALGNGSSTVTFNGGALSAADAAIDATGATSNVTFRNGALVTGTNALLNTHAGSVLSLNADNHSTLSGNITADAGTVANVALTNGSTLNSTVTNASAMNVDSNSLWNITGNSTVGSMELNNATAAFVADGVYKDLKVAGDFQGTGGRLVMNTFLNSGGSMSLQHTDRLLVQGNVTGTTMVQVNALGTGGETGNTNTSGISIIQVAGNSTEGAFTLQGGYAAAGAYQYRLYGYGPGSSNGSASADQALVGNASNYWDYRLQNPLIYADGTTQPGTTGQSGDNGQSGGNTTPLPSPNAHRLVTPQVPAYLTASTALFEGGLMDISSLHNRLGEVRQTNAAGRGDNGNMFVRAYGADMNYKSNLNFANYGYNADIQYSALQMGGNIFTHNGDNGNTWFGVAASYGALHFSPHAVDGTSNGNLNAYSVNAYATYQSKQGWYVDGIVGAKLFDGSISAAQAGKVLDVNGSGFSASLEAGYPIALNMGGMVLEPQAQLVYQQLGFKQAHETNGTPVDLGSPDQLTGRIGARLTRTFVVEGGGQITPYLKANFVHGFSGNSKVVVDTVNFLAGSYGNNAQVGVGLTGELTNRLSVYGDVTRQQGLGHGGTDSWMANGGMRLAF